MTTGPNVVPFYFQPSSYQDYRFRAPNMMLVRESFEHPLHICIMGGKIDILEEYVPGREPARRNGRGQSIRTHGVFPFSKPHCRLGSREKPPNSCIGRPLWRNRSFRRSSARRILGGKVRFFRRKQFREHKLTTVWRRMQSRANSSLPKIPC
jgi:hypothetical protein